MRTPLLLAVATLAAPLTLTGCEPPPMTASEQVEAVGLAVETARMDAATDDIIEITTSFTLGQALEDAAEELRAFWESQAPCATVTRELGVVTVDFGTSDGCTWNGRSWTGQASLELVSVEAGEARLSHTWTNLSNGVGSLDGGADVVWSATDASRTVSVDAIWTGPDHTLEVSSDRTIARLDPGGPIGTGIVIDGVRDWTLDGQTWTQTIDGVEMRAQDPAPQAGSYELVNPMGRMLRLSFERVDEDTIRVTTEARRTRSWLVTATGVEEE